MGIILYSLTRVTNVVKTRYKRTMDKKLKDKEKRALMEPHTIKWLTTTREHYDEFRMEKYPTSIGLPQVLYRVDSGFPYTIVPCELLSLHKGNKNRGIYDTIEKVVCPTNVNQKYGRLFSSKESAAFFSYREMYRHMVRCQGDRLQNIKENDTINYPKIAYRSEQVYDDSIPQNIWFVQKKGNVYISKFTRLKELEDQYKNLICYDGGVCFMLSKDSIQNEFHTSYEEASKEYIKILDQRIALMRDSMIQLRKEFSDLPLEYKVFRNGFPATIFRMNHQGDLYQEEGNSMFLQEDVIRLKKVD
jgi:hypothetical protein